MQVDFNLKEQKLQQQQTHFIDTSFYFYSDIVKTLDKAKLSACKKRTLLKKSISMKSIETLINTESKRTTNKKIKNKT